MYLTKRHEEILDKTLFITTGLGAANFEAAALRVQMQLEKCIPIENIVLVNSNNLDDLCPSTSTLFKELSRNETRGFGYWTWKSELVFRALSGDFGEFDSVVYLDSGCEVCLNSFSLRRLVRQILASRSKGAFVFGLGTPESLFSKEILKKEFSHKTFSDLDQVQATWFILSGSVGLAIASRWLEVTLKDLSYSDDSLSQNDVKRGVQSRNDQSIFSLTCRELGIEISKYRPVDGKSLKSKLRGFFQPIWNSRNRSGQSETYLFKGFQSTLRISSIFRA